ncbi:hypothetical protein HZR84_05500 [Hyphobacterium sp. CCMP332]|nr:hypothetical protein HZR84_05500 [Hyphobacterium sp. CCMP332]
MKKLIFLISLLFVFEINAQTVVVEKSKELVNGSKVDVVKTMLLIADSRKVEKQWSNFLKEFGKVQSQDGMLIVEEAIVNGISASVTSTSDITSYSRVTLKPEGTEVWWALQDGDQFIGPEHKSNKFERASNMLHQFGVDVYVNEINEDIAEADRVIDNAAREYDRLLRVSDNLDKRLEKNRFDRIKLEEKLVENANDSTQLKLQMQQNTTDQGNALKEIEKLKQARESIRAKLEDVK